MIFKFKLIAFYRSSFDSYNEITRIRARKGTYTHLIRGTNEITYHFNIDFDRFLETAFKKAIQFKERTLLAPLFEIT